MSIGSMKRTWKLSAQLAAAQPLFESIASRICAWAGEANPLTLHDASKPPGPTLVWGRGR